MQIVHPGRRLTNGTAIFHALPHGRKPCEEGSPGRGKKEWGTLPGRGEVRWPRHGRERTPGNAAGRRRCHGFVQVSAEALVNRSHVLAVRPVAPQSWEVELPGDWTAVNRHCRKR